MTVPKELIIVGSTIQYGACEPALCLKAIIVAGKISSEAVFKTASITISSDAVPLLGFIALSFPIAANPSGVAAFPIPKILALILEEISFVALFLYAFGNKNFNIGDIAKEIFLIKPFFSKTFIIPHHKHITPHNVMVNSTAELALSNIDFAIISTFFKIIAKEKARILKKAKIKPIILPQISFFSTLFDFLIESITRYYPDVIKVFSFRFMHIIII